jgi:hypothetical protein
MNTNLTFKVISDNKYIYLRLRKIMIKTLLIFLPLVFLSVVCISQTQELIQVKGMVVGLKLEPVPFAHVKVKSKRTGTISGSDGRFDLFLEKGDTIRVSCVGYKKGTYTIPRMTDSKIYHLLVVLYPDTIRLPEVTIFPWRDYKEFKEVFIRTKVPDDDIIRAEKNFQLMTLQAFINEDEMPSAPGAAYNLSMHQRNDLLYWKGQSQPMQLFNVFAWQQFFDYLKNGKFKRKKEKIKEDD